MPAIEALPGESVTLGLQLADGEGGLFPRAAVFGDGSAPLAYVDLGYRALGLYTGQWLPPCPGTYHAVYVVFDDEDRTQEAVYERATDSILVRSWDAPALGVAYDPQAQTLRLETGLTRSGAPVPPPTVVSAQVHIWDGDDQLLASASDPSPDGQGVFRLTVPTQALVANRLYTVVVTVTTTCGEARARRGFMTAV